MNQGTGLQQHQAVHFSESGISNHPDAHAAGSEGSNYLNGVVHDEGVDLGTAENRPRSTPQRPAPKRSQDDFARQLTREKRRAERSQRPLSVVLYQIQSVNAYVGAEADLLELLRQASRETDLIGHIGDGVIAVVCTDTDERGAHGYAKKIESLALSPSWFTTITATYPDQLFEILNDRSKFPTALHRLFVPAPSQREQGTYPLKRLMDITLSIAALLLFSPLMLGVAIAIAVTSPGPIIFKQIRLGKEGVPFVFYKFRSMAVNADDRIHRQFVADLIKGKPPQQETPSGGDAEGEAPQYKIRSDPRVTRIGRILRKTSIDELPQFFNVLKGDMSIVGPRPPIAYEAMNYEAWHLRRVLSGKPGITGLWQVEGRSKVSFNEMVRLDLRYIRECSLMLDLKILFKTILVVLRCDGAN